MRKTKDLDSLWSMRKGYDGGVENTDQKKKKKRTKIGNSCLLPVSRSEEMLRQK